MKSRAILLAALVTTTLTVSGVFLLSAQTPECNTYRGQGCIAPCRDPFGTGYYKWDNLGEPEQTTSAPVGSKDAISVGDRCADVYTGNSSCPVKTGTIGNDHVGACNPPGGTQ